MELPRSAPISPTLHSKSKKTYNSAMPFSPDADELYIENMKLNGENMKLSEENETLRKNFVNLRNEYDRLIHVIDIRKKVRKGILDKKYVDERQAYINEMREKYGKDLDMGTYTEEMLVGYNDPNIQHSPKGRKLWGGASIKKKKKPKNTRRKKTKPRSKGSRRK